MGIWYFRNENDLDYVVAFGDTPEEAWNRFLKSRYGQGCLNYIETNFNCWSYEPFTQETYGGALLFY